MRYLRGFLAGALIGGVGRFIVTFAWALAAFGTEERQQSWLVLPLVSGAIGLVVGGACGVTCKPILGALLGAILSGFSCLLAWAPIAIGHTGPPGSESRAQWETAQSLHLPAVVAMIVVGALAGGVGAWIGSREKGNATSPGAEKTFR